MKVEEFNKIVENQIEICKEILIKKAEEYATEDRLHNFKVAAGILGCTPIQALAGMMAKHTISIYDMCNEGTIDMAMWSEKITDHIKNKTKKFLIMQFNHCEELKNCTEYISSQAKLGVEKMINETIELAKKNDLVLTIIFIRVF